MAGILSDIKEIYGAIDSVLQHRDTVVGNKNRCQALISRCDAFRLQLKALSKDISVTSGLEVVIDCEKFIAKYGTKSFKRRCLKIAFANSIEEEFKALNDKITQETNDLNLQLQRIILKSVRVRTNDDDAAESAYNACSQQNPQIASSRDEKELILVYKEVAEIHGKQTENVEDLPSFEAQFPALLSNSTSLLDVVFEDPIASPIDSVSRSSNGSSEPSSNRSRAFKEVSFQTQIVKVDMDNLSAVDEKSKLGAGKFATVFRCSYFGEAVALKRFNDSSLSTEAIRLIAREARIMSLVRHPNILSFVACKAERGIILCQLAECSLFDILYNGATFEQLSGYDVHSPAVKLEWLIQVAQALRYLHFYEIIHRDIKPHNILLLVELGSRRATVKLSDFGIASALSHGISTVFGANAAAMGTDLYMAPELLNLPGGNLPPSTTAFDIYSFGVLANELMAEVLPWKGLMQIQIISLLNENVRPTPFIPSCSADSALLRLLGDSTGGCLAKDSSIRPDAGYLVSELQRILELRNSPDEIFSSILHKADDDDDAVAQFQVAECYTTGVNVAVDLVKAFHYYEQSAVQEHHIAQYKVGCCYAHGIGVRVNLVKAFRNFKWSADQGYLLAQLAVAECYESGKGCESDPEEAFEYYKLCADQGDALSQCKVGRFYSIRYPRRAFKYYRMSADQDNAVAQFNVGNCYAKGVGVDRNPEAAFQYFVFSCKLGYLPAIFAVADCYLNGVGVEESKKNAMKHFKTAADQGHAEAQYLLGRHHEVDSPRESFKYYCLSAKQKHPMATFEVAECYFQQRGVEKDVIKAEKYFKKAKKLGIAHATMVWESYSSSK